MAVTCNFPPDASVGTMRTLRLVRHLAAAGWHVHVVTAATEGFRVGTPTDSALLEKVPADVQVSRARAWRPLERLAALSRVGRRQRAPVETRTLSEAPTPEPRAARWTPGLKRALSASAAIPDREISWLLPAIYAGWQRARHAPPDVIFSSGPPFTAHLVGAVLARLLHRPWVADFRDPWARAPWREDRFAFEKRAWAFLERAVVARADAVVFVTETNRRDFTREYGDAFAPRFVVVPNGCDAADFAALVRQSPTAPGFVLLHAGSLYGARNPAPLLSAVRNAINRGAIDPERFRLRFVGRIGVAGLERAVRDLGLDRVVEFVSQVPRRAVLQEMIDASALLVVQPVTTVSVPAKLYEYMAAGRPVLALAEPGGETADVVRRTGAGIVVPSDDAAAIEQALLELIATSARRFTRVDPTAYDGELRAAQLGRLLAAHTRRNDDVSPTPGDLRRPANPAPRQVTRA
jgi:glycosyltransferase involved in cell wall biosynthesis